MENFYKQVMIEGKEENLPKEKGRYAVGIKGIPFSPLYLNAEDFNPAEDITKAKCNYRSSAKYWLESFDSYLQPVQLSVPSDEKVDKEYYPINFIKYLIWDCNWDLSQDRNGDLFWTDENGIDYDINAMYKYFMS